jgi:hypothetical protein
MVSYQIFKKNQSVLSITAGAKDKAYVYADTNGLHCIQLGLCVHSLRHRKQRIIEKGFLSISSGLLECSTSEVILIQNREC